VSDETVAKKAAAAAAEADDRARYGRAEFGMPLSRASHAFRWIAKATVGRIARLYFRIEMVQVENYPTTGPFILAPSHRSNIDTALLGASMPRWHRYMAKDDMFRSPFWTQFTIALGGFPVRRGKLDREVLASALRVLENGEPLTIYPEGARQDGPRIKPIFEGAVWVAARAGVPIVPLGIGGSAAANPIGEKMIYPRKTVLVYGEPMHLPKPPEGKRRLPRSALEDAAAELRERLQAVFDEAQELAGTPNGAWSPEEEVGRREPWKNEA